MDNKLNRNTGYNVTVAWAMLEFTSLNRDLHLHQPVFLHCSDMYISCVQQGTGHQYTNHTEANITGPNRERKHGFFSVTQTLNCNKIIKIMGYNGTT